MNEFETVKDCRFEHVVNKSRFIGICRRVHFDSDATAFLREIRGEFSDCTHICHAYVSGESSHSSDDGEPSGTAGTPIMESIASARLKETAVAVVRYFGGIKLGTGGLTRAYSYTAAQTLLRAERVEVAECDVIRASFDYSVYKKIEKRQLQSLYKMLRLEYNKTVDITYATQDADALMRELTALTQARCSLERAGSQTVERGILRI